MLKKKQRTYPSADLKWYVHAVTPKGPIEGVTKDISTRGAYVCCANPLGLNEVVVISITTPEKSFDVKAEVVWSNIYGPDDDINPRGMGVCFVKISSKDRKFIAREVSQHSDDAIEFEKLETITLEVGDD